MDEVKASERQVIPILLLYFAAYEFIKESREASILPDTETYGGIKMSKGKTRLMTIDDKIARSFSKRH
ncbi:MAG: hypothetical protein WCF07_11725 [Nitrososphaeraceae archaeon]